MAVHAGSGSAGRQARAMRRYRLLYRQSRRTRPSLLEGVASLFDFAGVFAPRVSVTAPPDSDAEAIASDWDAVGNDLWAAIGAVKPEPTDEA